MKYLTRLLLLLLSFFSVSAELPPLPNLPNEVNSDEKSVSSMPQERSDKDLDNIQKLEANKESEALKSHDTQDDSMFKVPELPSEVKIEKQEEKPEVKQEVSEKNQSKKPQNLLPFFKSPEVKKDSNIIDQITEQDNNERKSEIVTPPMENLLEPSPSGPVQLVPKSVIIPKEDLKQDNTNSSAVNPTTQAEPQDPLQLESRPIIHYITVDDQMPTDSKSNILEKKSDQPLSDSKIPLGPLDNAKKSENKIQAAEEVTGIVEQEENEIKEAEDATGVKKESLFIERELKLLFLADDDVVLGNITEECSLENMDFLDYVAFCEKTMTNDEQIYKAKKTEHFLKNAKKNRRKLDLATAKIVMNDDVFFSREEVQDFTLEASIVGDLEFLRSMIDNYYTIDVKDDNGNSLLILAVKNQHEKIVAYLLRKGLDPNIPNYNGVTPLMIASKSHSRAIIRMLKEAGAIGDIDPADMEIDEDFEVTF